MTDAMIAWAILITVGAAYGLAPDSIRERWWAALTRRSDQ